jgi:hypothetical protein
MRLTLYIVFKRLRGICFMGVEQEKKVLPSALQRMAQSATTGVLSAFPLYEDSQSVEVETPLTNRFILQ